VSYCDQYVGCMPTIASKRCLLWKYWAKFNKTS